MELSDRLKLIAGYVKKCDFLADIGTDHAYIPVYLLQKGIIKRAVGSDISRGSVEKARKNAQRYGMTEFIDLRCGDGLEAIRDDEQPDCIVIAGMGGMLAIEVMKKKLSVLKGAERIILQPQRDIDRVRYFMHENGFKIVDEAMIIEDKKFYNVIVCEKGKDSKYGKYDYWFGKKLIERKNPALKEYISCELHKMNIVFASLEGKNKEHIVERKKQIEERYKGFKEVLLWL